MFDVQNNIDSHSSVKKIIYSTIVVLILLLSLSYKLYQPVKYLGVPETDTWDFAIKSDFIAQNHYTTALADGVYATHNAVLQLILNIPQEYIAIFGGQITFLLPLLFFIIARRCSKNQASHLFALFVGSFLGLERTVLYTPETFSYIFILLFIYLSGLFYILNRKKATLILLVFTSWVYMLFHQSGMSAYFALGVFAILNGVVYRKQIACYFKDLIKNQKSLIVAFLVFGVALVALISSKMLDPLIGQLRFYLTSAAKIASPNSYLGLYVPPFSELTKNISFMLVLICLAIILISKKRKKLAHSRAFFFFSSLSFTSFYFIIIYILPRIGFEVPVIWRFYTWFGLSAWISFIILLSIILKQSNKKFLSNIDITFVFIIIIAVSVMPISPEINVQFSGTVDTLQSVKNIRAQKLIKPNSILYTQWYYGPSLKFGFSGYSELEKDNIEIVSIGTNGFSNNDGSPFADYFESTAKKINKDQKFEHNYFILSKYLLDFSKTQRASGWTKSMSNGNLNIEALKDFSIFQDILYEDEYNILFELSDEFI